MHRALDWRRSEQSLRLGLSSVPRMTKGIPGKLPDALSAESTLRPVPVRNSLSLKRKTAESMVEEEIWMTPLGRALLAAGRALSNAPVAARDGVLLEHQRGL